MRVGQPLLARRQIWFQCGFDKIDRHEYQIRAANFGPRHGDQIRVLGNLLSKPLARGSGPAQWYPQVTGITSDINQDFCQPSSKDSHKRQAWQSHPAQRQLQPRSVDFIYAKA